MEKKIKVMGDYRCIFRKEILQKILLLFFICGINDTAHAQVDSIVGNWKTVDDKTNEVRAMVRIFKATNGLYYGKIEKMYKYAAAVCDKCEGDDKGKPIQGLMIIRGMKAENGVLKDGYVLDPESGKKYYGTISYDKSSKKLKLRGSIDRYGILGRNQYWVR
ncbi:MAG: DUF2147 domain-containing protein [Bacteroidales bacterium]|jgi:uncharacterized protein (DUF2147 family)|nr:DUF2147 domain-containing protein [Bacteroidales bacterium]